MYQNDLNETCQYSIYIASFWKQILIRVNVRFLHNLTRIDWLEYLNIPFWDLLKSLNVPFEVFLFNDMHYLNTNSFQNWLSFRSVQLVFCLISLASSLENGHHKVSGHLKNSCFFDMFNWFCPSQYHQRKDCNQG